MAKRMRSGVSFEICTVIFVLFSLTITKGDITRMRAIEGDKIELDFRYPSECARLTLRNGMRAPFYDSAEQRSMSLPENQKLAFQNESDSNNCLLQFKINPVLRLDEGGYILTAYGGDGNIIEDSRVGLRVDYPPGMASCRWGEENVADDWRPLDCTAPSGSLPGGIVCYQDRIRTPPMGRPRDSDSILEQTIWVRYSQPAFCCALVVGKTVDRCKCKDYTWDPSSNLTEPCPVVMVTTHQATSTSSLSPTSSLSKEVAQGTKKNHRSNVVLHVIYSCVIGISAMIIIGLFHFIALRKSNRNAIPVKKYGEITYSQPNRVDVHEYDKSGKNVTADLTMFSHEVTLEFATFI